MLQTLEQFVMRHAIRMECQEVEKNPHLPDFPRYKVQLERVSGQSVKPKSFIIYVLGKPSVTEVLRRLAHTSQTIPIDPAEDAGYFAEWCDLCGHPQDKAAKKTYRLYRQNQRKLQRFLGAEIYRELLYHTEGC